MCVAEPITGRYPLTAYGLADRNAAPGARAPGLTEKDDGMPGRVTDLLVIDESFWDRSDVIVALRARDVGRLFRLLAQYTGASQTRLAIACQTTQPKVSGYMRGIALVEALEVFERIADGLAMPDRARVALGLAPIEQPARRQIPSRDASPVSLAAGVSGRLSAHSADGEEGESLCYGEPSSA